MDFKEIKLIVDLMKRNDLSVFLLEKEGFKILLRRGPTGGIQASGAPALTPGFHQTPLPSQTAPAPTAETAAAPAPAAAPKGPEITSPMVGTFYAAMSPDSPPYIKVGQSVTPDMVVCIIEAMKVMNEIKAEMSGVVAEVLGENGKPVQFGQPLFRLQA